MLPFMASNALQVFYSTIDMVIVGEYVKTPGISAVSMSSQILNFATMVSLGFSNAGQVLISQALGAGKRKEMGLFIHVFHTVTSQKNASYATKAQEAASRGSTLIYHSKKFAPGRTFTTSPRQNSHQMFRLSVGSKSVTLSVHSDMELR